MLFYGISEQKIKTILKSPSRKEEGVAEKTFAVMKRNDTPKRKEELWVMYAAVGASSKYKVESRKVSSNPKTMVMISTWRYPGKSKPGKEIPIPDDIADYVNSNLRRVVS